MRLPLTIPGNHCVVHGYHWPKPARTVRHHIWPLGLGGPDTNANLVLVCDTGHFNIHAYIDAFLSGRALPKITRSERTLAQLGIDRYTAGGL